jgi:hypothetical protein
MSVVVHPRLSQLLQERNLTAVELARLIEARYGLTVAPDALSGLMRADQVERADLTVAGAAAAALGVDLGELFDVAALPVAGGVGEELESFLDDDQSRRLAELLARQGDTQLTAAERHELDTLVTEYGRQFSERKLRQFARRRGISIEQARREADAEVARAAARWHEIAASRRRAGRTG